MLKKENKTWLHTLFKRNYLFKRYWFIESAVILVIWIVVIALSMKSSTDWVKKFSWLTWYTWIWEDPTQKQKIVLGVAHLIFVALAVFVNVYKRFKICKSLSCYLGESESEKFKKEKKILNLATSVSTAGIMLATPIIYFLSFIFKLIFICFVRKEEKKQQLKVNQENKVNLV